MVLNKKKEGFLKTTKLSTQTQYFIKTRNLLLFEQISMSNWLGFSINYQYNSYHE